MSQHHWFRYAFEKAFDPGEAPQRLRLRLQRNLEVRGVRPADGMTYEEAIQRVFQGSGIPLEKFDLPQWPLDASSYAPDPKRLAEAEREFAITRDCPLIDPDPIMDGTITSSWWRLIELGKPALYLYCQYHKEVVRGPEDPEDHGFLLMTWVSAIDSAASLLADRGEFKPLATALRVPLSSLPPEGQIPRNLLGRFDLLMNLADEGLEVQDPERWWLENERGIPDLDGRGESISWPLGDPDFS